MPREPRIEEPGAIYHVTSRGNAGEAIVRSDFERNVFLAVLGRTVERHRWTCLAYCLMTTHYHLVVAPAGGLSAGMRDLNGSFSRQMNRRRSRFGHLFQNRFAAKQIQGDVHLLEACRYVVLNPVRAHVCAFPGGWRWSSYRACVGDDFPPPFLAVDEVLRLFAPRPTEARRRYRAFIAAARPPMSDTRART